MVVSFPPGLEKVSRTAIYFLKETRADERAENCASRLAGVRRIESIRTICRHRVVSLA